MNMNNPINITLLQIFQRLVNALLTKNNVNQKTHNIKAQGWLPSNQYRGISNERV